MNFPLFVAKRLFFDNSDSRKVSRPAITIATAGVAIGIAVMIVSVFVVLGFKHTIRNKVIGFGSHIQVTNFMTQMSSDQYPIVMSDSMMSVIRGIAGVADKLNIKLGQRVFAYFINNDGVRVRRFTIAGVYQTNLNQYDEVMCFTDLYTAVKLNGWKPDQASGAEVTVNDFDKVNTVEQQFVKKVNKTTDHYGETYTSQTIQDLNPQIFQWLDLLDMNVWIILALMISVAGVTMISGLLIIILERTTMIGVFKALGARNTTIRHMFLWFATFIIGRGLLIGNAVGIGFALLQKYLGIVKLNPATYYVSTVPIELNVPALLLINVLTLAVSVFVLIAPSYLISHIHPARSMRYE